MSIRALRMPDDFHVMAELIPQSFQYPENRAWSVQEDEAKELVTLLNNVARLWPVLQWVVRFSPDLRHIFDGNIWEEDGKPVGLCRYGRMKDKLRWSIYTVATLPEYRHRGIGAGMVRAAIDDIDKQEGKFVYLDVIRSNIPVVRLYQQLGFKPLSSEIMLNYPLMEGAYLPDFELQPGYSLAWIDENAWRVDYDLTCRIKPPTIQQYEPIDIHSFRPSPAVHLLLAIIQKIMMAKHRKTVVISEFDQQPVATGSFEVKHGVNRVHHISVLVDPNHSRLSLYLVTQMTKQVMEANPTGRIEFVIPDWQKNVIDAACQLGFTSRMEYLKMCLALEN